MSFWPMSTGGFFSSAATLTRNISLPSGEYVLSKHCRDSTRPMRLRSLHSWPSRCCGLACSTPSRGSPMFPGVL
ncbi:hypothetical protein BO94DRAFT_139927 [Aspergillus sclerotioniger CBS 115572]|uniref:Uncharacterized protein n=1 Tax=Aspergillus sclerotioniger CBS 115572 TaxID=1450535 RepID=A0A317XGB7_9EURO|nr:hypothetical protein BO94DRAFT_139927 [Aspergillus sclerotioniger CBS 115572]PWY95890.1 hypothetical protein BO94DRAFT_139927 [Aspergillus sclerotioniger CBS 115572]